MKNTTFLRTCLFLAVIFVSLPACNVIRDIAYDDLMANYEVVPFSPTVVTIRGGNMQQLPRTDNALVLRTDFSDQAAWEEIYAEIIQPVGVFQAYVDFVDNDAYQDITRQRLLQLVPENYEHSFIILVDHMAVSSPEHTLLIVDLFDEPGREFRAAPSEIQGIENNLSIANMFFSDFADNVDEDGVFRGFPVP